jgi:hypothetical protein
MGDQSEKTRRNSLIDEIKIFVAREVSVLKNFRPYDVSVRWDCHRRKHGESGKKLLRAKIKAHVHGKTLYRNQGQNT